jgi:hypothetical protein
MLKKTYHLLGMLLIAFIAIVGIPGCQHDNDNGNGISNPVIPRNITAVGTIRAFSTLEEFRVEAPAGSYLLTYTTQNGTFETVFTSTSNAAVLPVTLQPGEAVLSATLQSGTILPTAPIMQQTGAITIFTQPGTAAGSSGNIFVPNLSITPITLV